MKNSIVHISASPFMSVRFLALSVSLFVGCARNVPEDGFDALGGSEDPDAGATTDLFVQPDTPVRRDATLDRPPPADIAPVVVPAGCGVATIVTRAFFDAIYPAAGRNPVFTYDGFIQAAQGYPEFVATGDMDSCRREAAAFLANVSRETGNLRFVDQIAKDRYCQTRAGCVCDATTTDQTKWYYGRGAIQLSWNYNYCAAGAALGADLIGNPSLVSTTPELAWGTALWFWMRGAASCHAAMQRGGGGFGATIRIINGGVECDKGGYGVQQGVTERVNRYIDYAGRLGITDPGTPAANGC
jgi:predicted chitinase